MVSRLSLFFGVKITPLEIRKSAQKSAQPSEKLRDPLRERVYLHISIRANTKNGKIVSYRFTVCLGRDCNGKQIRKYTTWPIPPDTSTVRAKKAAERAADIWEQELMSEYHKKLEVESSGKAYQIPAEKRHDDFVSFVNDVWFPLQVRDGKHKPKTVAFYESMTKLLLPCFRGSTLQGISSLDIQRCLAFLHTEHKNQHGKPLTPKTLHHLYNTLNLIFGFAEKQELLVKNPISLFNFAYKRLTFASTPELEYTLGSPRKIAHRRLTYRNAGCFTPAAARSVSLPLSHLGKEKPKKADARLWRVSAFFGVVAPLGCAAMFAI